MSFPYKNPISPSQLSGQQSLERTKTYGTSYSTLSTGGYMEVYSLDQLYYTIPPSTYGPIEYSGNTIPITFSKGSGTTFSYDTLTLQPDNISSGRRKLGMLVYVKEVDQVYQYNIDNYLNLFTAATASTSTVVISDFGTTIKGNSAAGLLFISGWTANTIDGVSGVTRTNAVWKKYYGNNLSITGGTFNSSTGTLTLTNITGGTQNISGFGSGGGGGDSITGGTFDKNLGELTLNSTGSSITITGFTDVFTTGGTYDNGAKTLELYDNSGNTIIITGFTSPSSGTTIGAYGSFSLNTNLSVSGANTETVWTYDTDEISNGIYISGGSKIRVTQYGIYSIGYSAQIEKTQGGTATDVTIWAKINGSPISRSSSTTTLVSNSAYILPFVSYIFELYPTDYLEFYFSAPSQYVQLTSLSGLTSPTRPDSPALIVVAQSVLGTVATFTGNTSATCINDLYVDNLYGCSPINVNDLLIGNSGITSDNITGLTIVNNYIETTGNTIVIDLVGSKLNDSSGNQSINLTARRQYDSNSVVTADWETKSLNDSTGVSSVSWETRGLFDSAGLTSQLWTDRRLYDVNEIQSLDYNSRGLQNSNSVEVLNWESGLITGFTNIVSTTISATTYLNLPSSPGGGISGSGTTNKIPKFTASTSIGNSIITDDGTNVTISGNEIVSGSFSGNVLFSTQSSGDEGGQLDLFVPQTNTTLSGTTISLDIYQNRFRIFESSSPNRGVYIDLSTTSNGVGTNLLSNSSFVQITANTTTTNLTYTDVAGLSITPSTTGVYEFIVVLFTGSDTAAGMRIGMSVPASSTNFYYMVQGVNSAAANQTFVEGAASGSLVTTFACNTFNGQTGVTKIDGIVTTTQSGEIKIGFAKITSGTATIRAGSYIRITKIA